MSVHAKGVKMLVLGARMQIQEQRDSEAAHRDADAILVEALRLAAQGLTYEKIVEEDQEVIDGLEGLVGKLQQALERHMAK